jgi:DNA polymerase I-like protein with 3'-5' exonuclease and polymerase domains/uracil-DNA glycosylase
MSLIKPSGPAPARIMIVAEFPSDSDVRSGLALSDGNGHTFNDMLKDAGILRSQCFVTSALKVRPPGGDVETLITSKKKSISAAHVVTRDRHILPLVCDHMQILAREIEQVQPNVIIALGNAALWMLTGCWSITSWRGSMLECDLPLGLPYKPKVLPTLPPGFVNMAWEKRGIVVSDLRRAAKMAQTRELIRPEYNFILRPDFALACRYLDLLQRLVEAEPTKLSVDIETRAYHIACIGLAWSPRDAMCLPLMCTERASGYWSEAEEAEIVWRLRRLLTHPNAQVVGQNFHYDAQYIDRYWLFTPRLVRDTMIAQHSCFSTMPKGLDYLSSMYCDFHEYWKDEGKEWNPAIPEDQYWGYNCKDAVITYEVDSVEQSLVDQLGVRAPHDFQQRLWWPVFDTMRRGVRIDEAARARFRIAVQAQIDEREQWLTAVLGESINIRSPAQMCNLFYIQLGQPVVLGRKTKTPSTDDEALNRIAAREPALRPVVEKIQELRSLSVFMSTFINSACDVDGRMRSSFSIPGTDTYRFSSSANAFGSGLNLQNIPKGGESDRLALPNIRSMFIPDPGRTFFDIDLSSADLRIVVWEADEPEMKAMLREGLDPYTEVAKEFYHDPSLTKKDPRRQLFKSFCHGTNYLGTAKGLAERLGLSVAEAEKTQAWYFGKFPRIKRWQDDLKDQVVKRRMVENIFGYRRYFLERIEGTIFNVAAAWIPQSTVGCLINRAYMAIAEQEPSIEVLLQVHDSLAGQFPTSDEERCTRRVIELAEIPLPYSDPLVIPVGCKTSRLSWGDCE